MAVGLIVLILGVLDLIYALADEYSIRRKALKVLFWILYPVLLVTFMTGRQARQDRGTHLLHAIVITGLGLLIVGIALYYG
jgi:uncharacterized membrane protein HdeD (DUF308 family)